jgi:hypothetical protein
MMSLSLCTTRLEGFFLSYLPREVEEEEEEEEVS